MPFLRLGALFLVLFLTTCSTAHHADEDLGFHLSEKQGSASRLWSHDMPGLVTDLNLSQDGSRVLISMVPDTEGMLQGKEERQIREPVLALLNGDGKILWQKSLGARPKWQSLSETGDFAVAATYEGKLFALDGKSKILWEKDNYCRPVILMRSKRVICFRGDDAKPTGIGFDLYDFAGNALATYSVPQELLEWNISADENRIVLALESGLVQVIDGSTFKMIWEAKVPSEILSVGVSSGLVPLVAALYYRKNEIGKHVATVAVFDPSGKQVDQISPDGHFDVLAISPDNGSIVLYGNNPHGQALVSLARKPASGAATDLPLKFAEIWRQNSSHFSDYSSPLFATEGRIIAGFEDTGASEPNRSIAHLFAFDQQGKVEWMIPMVGEDGGYLFSYSRSTERPVLIGASDSGVVSAYELENP